MQLVEAGKIELDAPVQRYLPWFRVADPVASAHITVRHLLTQVSGLSREMKEKLGRVRPATIGQASRIPGVTPAAVSLINIYIEIQGRQQAV